jgi:predicted Abi (CAAX) family protease
MFAVLPVYLLLRPSLVEEKFFRAVLLPRDTTRVRRPYLITTAVVALTAFIVSHPINAWLFRPAALVLFTNPMFLVCATLLGIMCTLTYLISRSLWPPVLFHWITVVIWILFLGGQGLIGTPLDASQR